MDLSNEVGQSHTVHTKPNLHTHVHTQIISGHKPLDTTTVRPVHTGANYFG